MNWDAFGAIAEMLGAIAVFATLLYLSMQVRASARAVGIETERDINEAWNVTMAEWASDERIADILGRGFANYSALPQPEKAVFHTRVGRVLNHHYTQHRMSEQGMGDPAFLKAMDQVALSILHSPGGRQWWDDIGPFYAHYEAVQRMIKDQPNVRPFSDVAIWKRHDG